MVEASDVRSQGVAGLFGDQWTDAHRMAEARRQAAAPRVQQTTVQRCRRRCITNLSLFDQVWRRCRLEFLVVFNKLVYISRKSTKRENNSTASFIYFSSPYLEKKSAKAIRTTALRTERLFLLLVKPFTAGKRRFFLPNHKWRIPGACIQRHCTGPMKRLFPSLCLLS